MTARPGGAALSLERGGGRWAVAGASYRLSGTDDGPTARLADADGRPWADIRLTASVDPVAGVDETHDVTGPRERPIDGAGVGLTWLLVSSCWATKRLIVEARGETLTIRVEVDGRGDLGEVTLLGGRVVRPAVTGRLWSGAWFESVVSAAPGDPGRIVQPAAESSSIGVSSGSEPGRGRWFFTPAPFVVAASRAAVGDATLIPDGPWLAFALDAARGDARFTEVAYRAQDRGFAFVLDYEGHTRVDGGWSSPPLVIHEASDPFAAIAAQRERLADTADSPAAAAWWREPIFCGWGAQCAAVAAAGQPLSAAPARSTQADYDRFLAALEARGIIPGTIAIDDKWQRTYGTNEPETSKWPDLRGWIADRHRRGQRVLLWYKAWDLEGLPPEACIRTTGGTPVALDPSSPAGEMAIRRSIRSMLAPDAIDADGIKIDFTARTPSGHGLVHHGPDWGVDLLARLLEVVADEARSVRPDPLLVAQTPNPIFAPSVDMIRLNDLLRLDDPEPAVDTVPQMRYRAAVARAALPGDLIDTDDWCAPDLAAWRAYAAIKAELGIPALYYVDRLDRTGETLRDDDFELIRRTWAEHRKRFGLPQRGAV